MKYYSIVYIGLKLDEEEPDHVIDQFITTGLKKLAQKFKHDNLCPDNYDSLFDNGWKRPNPPYHITSLFVNKKKENCEKEEFKQFKIGIPAQLAVKGLFVVEDYLMCAMFFPQSVPVENNVPHMTLLLKDGRPYDSNVVLENLMLKKKLGPQDLADDIAKQYFKGKISLSLSTLTQSPYRTQRKP